MNLILSVKHCIALGGTLSLIVAPILVPIGTIAYAIHFASKINITCRNTKQDIKPDPEPEDDE